MEQSIRLRWHEIRAEAQRHLAGHRDPELEQRRRERVMREAHETVARHREAQRLRHAAEQHARRALVSFWRCVAAADQLKKTAPSAEERHQRQATESLLKRIAGLE